MDEATLIDKLRLIEALVADGATGGERVAAERARERIRARLAQRAKEDPPVEFKFRMPDIWTRKVLLALLRRYGLEPYRYPGQHRTTVMVRAPDSFIKHTFWPEFEQFASTLSEYLAEVSDRVVQQVLESDSSEARVALRGRGLAPQKSG